MTNTITATPDDYKQTKLYQQLQKESIKNGDGLVANVDKFITVIQPILNTIGRDAFSDYTLHNPLHSRKLLHLSGFIIPDDVVGSLSSLELTVLIMSFYLHDLGMVSLYDDKAAILASDEFQTFLYSHDNFSSRITSIREEIEKADDANKPLLENVLSQLNNAALTDYLRPKHADIDRYESALAKVLDGDDKEKLFQIDGVSFKKELLQICHSHMDSSYTLSAVDSTTGKMVFDLENYICRQTFNMQYCAAILRIADIMDFDMERTPESLYRAIGIADKQLPGFKISLKEWTKQMAVHTITITDNEIMVKGNCNSPSIENAIREMCAIIEREIRDTMSVVRSAKADIAARYHIDLPQNVRVDIRSNGYTYKDYSIQLNDSAIRNLLMGNNLYSRNYVAARELIQNAVDACQVRKRFEKYGYIPQVKVFVTTDANNRRWLVVQDNGIGMDDKVLSDYFFKIGNSYYRSEEFKALQKEKKITDFTPSSRFGIGILSVFMIGNIVKITTANKHSVRKDYLQRTLIIDNTESLAVVQESPATESGTKIEVQLHSDKDNDTFINGLLGSIKDSVIRPSIPVILSALDKTETKIESARYNKLSEEMRSILDTEGIKPVVIDLSKHSEILKGYAFLFFFEKSDGTLSYVDPEHKIGWGDYPLKATSLLEGTSSSSRVTVNGVTMMLKKIGGIFNTKKRIVPFLIDVEIESRKDITFDVSRTKINGAGLEIVKKEIYNSIEQSLKDMGIFAKFDQETRNQFGKAKVRNVPATPLDKVFLEKIEPLLPSSAFTVTTSIVREVSEKMNEDPEIVRKYVYAVAQKYK